MSASHIGSLLKLDFVLNYVDMCYRHEHVLNMYISQSLVAGGYVKGIGVP